MNNKNKNSESTVDFYISLNLWHSIIINAATVNDSESTTMPRWNEKDLGHILKRQQQPTNTNEKKIEQSTNRVPLKDE